MKDSRFDLKLNDSIGSIPTDESPTSDPVLLGSFNEWLAQKSLHVSRDALPNKNALAWHCNLGQMLQVAPGGLCNSENSTEMQSKGGSDRKRI